MTDHEPNHDADDSLDEQLSHQLRTMSSPSPAKLEHATRQHIARYQRRRRLVQAAIFLLAFVVSVGTIRWIGRHQPNAPQVAQSEVPATAQLDEQELMALFGPPPVDPLTLLDRQQQISYQALKQWDRSR